MSQKGIDFHVKIQKHVPTQFKSDKRRMMQVIINLIQNAFKFTNKGAIVIDVQFTQTETS